MASKRQLKRFIFKLERKLVREQKKLSSKLYKELQRQMKEIIANDGIFESRTHDILMDAYLTIGVEFASKQFDALTTGDYSKANRFFLEYWKEWIKNFVTIRVAEKVKNMDSWSSQRYTEIKQQVRNAITESGTLSIPHEVIADAIEKKLGSSVFSRNRAMTIARTETASIANEAKAKSAETWADENGQKQFKMWVHRNSKNPRENHEYLDGMILPVEEYFQVFAQDGEPEDMLYPHDPNNGSAKNKVNCNCQVVYMSEDYVNQLNS